MKKIIFISFLLFACNQGNLVNSPVPSPSATPKTVEPTTLDCGNADFQVFDSYDPDDNPSSPDSYVCYWLCATDTGSFGFPGDPFPPHEVAKRFDLDVPDPAYQTGPTTYAVCNSLMPQ